MREFHLDGAAITDGEMLHAKLAEGLDFPSWYGGNLDALYDCLTDMDDEIRLSVSNASQLEDALGRYALRFFQVLEDAAAENVCLQVSVE